jgi:hypothetical protein
MPRRTEPDPAPATHPWSAHSNHDATFTITNTNDERVSDVRAEVGTKSRHGTTSAANLDPMAALTVRILERPKEPEPTATRLADITIPQLHLRGDESHVDPQAEHPVTVVITWRGSTGWRSWSTLIP